MRPWDKRRTSTSTGSFHGPCPRFLPRLRSSPWGPSPVVASREACRSAPNFLLFHTPPFHNPSRGIIPLAVPPSDDPGGWQQQTSDDCQCPAGTWGACVVAVQHHEVAVDNPGSPADDLHSNPWRHDSGPAIERNNWWNRTEPGACGARQLPTPYLYRQCSRILLPNRACLTFKSLGLTPCTRNIFQVRRKLEGPQVRSLDRRPPAG